MGDFLARVWEFVSAVVSNWYAWIGAISFAIDQGLSRKFLSAKLVDRIDKRWPTSQRHSVFKTVCLAALVVACFQAYDHVNMELKQLRSRAPVISANRWEPLAAEESLSLRGEFKRLAPERLSVLCAFSGCTDLALSIYTAAHDLNWTGNYEGWYLTDHGIVQGIEIWSHQEKAKARQQIADAIERATKGRLKISSREWEGVAAPEHAADINLVIGRTK